MDDSLMDGWLFRSFVDEGRPFIFLRGIPYLMCDQKIIRREHVTVPHASVFRFPSSPIVRVVCCRCTSVLFPFFGFRFSKIDKGHRPFLSLCRQQTTTTTRQEVSLAVLAFHLLFSINPNKSNSFFSISF